MRSILIAEGNAAVVELFAALFARDGWTVTTHSDGLRADDALRGSIPYTAVLVGNRLLGISGVELIGRTRALGHRNDVPIVMITGTVDVTVAAGALAAGADGILYKPADVTVLVDMVNKCVERRPRRARALPRLPE
jgi:DNA-binding response OmpR family regulator